MYTVVANNFVSDSDQCSAAGTRSIAINVKSNVMTLPGVQRDSLQVEVTCTPGSNGSVSELAGGRSAGRGGEQCRLLHKEHMDNAGWPTERTAQHTGKAVCRLLAVLQPVLQCVLAANQMGSTTSRQVAVAYTGQCLNISVAGNAAAFATLGCCHFWV